MSLLWLGPIAVTTVGAVVVWIVRDLIEMERAALDKHLAELRPSRDGVTTRRPLQ